MLQWREASPHQMCVSCVSPNKLGIRNKGRAPQALPTIAAGQVHNPAGRHVHAVQLPDCCTVGVSHECVESGGGGCDESGRHNLRVVGEARAEGGAHQAEVCVWV